jgi:hypothetical protein
MKKTTKDIYISVEHHGLARELIAIAADVENDCPIYEFLQYCVLWL